MKPTPGQVDEPVSITAYDPSWPALFSAERTRVEAALGDVVSRTEHFGSTAVPGMAGKPIVDLLVGVTDLRAAAGRIPSLETLGYENFGEIFIPGRIYLRRRGAHAFNIAMTVEGSDFWRESLIVRDYLRAHPEEAAAYAAQKRAIYAEGSRSFSTYSQAKGPYLAALKARALQWHRRLRGDHRSSGPSGH
jgi:GrpB-like predicted nucleotidyltransferase (UPF0157 family)